MADIAFVLFCQDIGYLEEIKSKIENGGVYQFSKEKHGDGPEHWVTELAPKFQFELYLETKPREDGQLFGIVINNKFTPIGKALEGLSYLNIAIGMITERDPA
jgi:hypothetical protein